MTTDPKENTNPEVKASRVIGVVVYDFKDPFFGAIIEQLQTQAHKYNFSLVLAGFLNRDPDERDLQYLTEHDLDGLIVTGTDLKAEWLEQFQHIPVARIGCGREDEKSVKIRLNDDQAARLLLDHLVKTGRKKITFISTDLFAHQLRCDAFEMAAVDYDVELDIHQSAAGDTYNVGIELAKDLKISDVDALVCTNDQMAMGALHTLNERGVKVPKKVAVTGFDDITSASRFIPSITTIQQPIAEMVSTAVYAIINQSPPSQIELAPKLIVRKSA